MALFLIGWLTTKPSHLPFGCLTSAVLDAGVVFQGTTATMAMKAVCVLKGAGDTSGTVHFEQEVSCQASQETLSLLNLYGHLSNNRVRSSCVWVLKWLAKLFGTKPSIKLWLVLFPEGLLTPCNDRQAISLHFTNISYSGFVQVQSSH